MQERPIEKEGRNGIIILGIALFISSIINSVLLIKLRIAQKDANDAQPFLWLLHQMNERIQGKGWVDKDDVNDILRNAPACPRHSKSEEGE